MQYTWEQLKPHVGYWLKLIQEAKLGGQAWQTAGYYRHLLRNNKSECPLCALANSVRPTGYKCAWRMAIQAALGDFGDIDDTALALIAAAADDNRSPLTLRGKLKAQLFRACRGESFELDHIQHEGIVRL